MFLFNIVYINNMYTIENDWYWVIMLANANFYWFCIVLFELKFFFVLNFYYHVDMKISNTKLKLLS